jgi:hypothetical protein
MTVLRRGISSILKASGFTVEIYEEDSTPSFEPATYLKDIEHADFVIFIFDETYGTPRSSTGRSGIHEEWNAVKAKQIPNHVYLRRRPATAIQAEQQAFIKTELQEREISYFYYSSESELRMQVRRSIVKMALEIARSPDFRSNLSRRTLAGEVAKRDHRTYHLWDRAIRTTDDIEENGNCMTTGWSIISDIYVPFSAVSIRPFIDQKTQELFSSFLAAVNELTHYEGLHVLGYSGEIATLPFPTEPQILNRLQIAPPLPSNFHEKRAALKVAALKAWRRLGVFIAKRYSKYADF